MHAHNTVTLEKQSEQELEERRRWFWAVAPAVSGTTALVFSWWWFGSISLRPIVLFLIGWFLFAHCLVAQRTLSYHLCDDALRIRYLTGRRTIFYRDIDTVLVTDYQWPFGISGLLTPAVNIGYYVGLARSQHWGYVDAACSTVSGQAVALVLKEERPMLFTPIDPERVADEIRARVRAARLQ